MPETRVTPRTHPNRGENQSPTNDGRETRFRQGPTVVGSILGSNVSRHPGSNTFPMGNISPSLLTPTRASYPNPIGEGKPRGPGRWKAPPPGDLSLSMPVLQGSAEGRNYSGQVPI